MAGDVSPDSGDSTTIVFSSGMEVWATGNEAGSVDGSSSAEAVDGNALQNDSDSEIGERKERVC